jgi:small subunit ribosomal protein S21
MKVVVKEGPGGLEKAIRVMKKKLQKEGFLRDLKQKQYYEKPSARRQRKKSESIKRHRRALKKRMERLGY